MGCVLACANDAGSVSRSRIRIGTIRKRTLRMWRTPCMDALWMPGLSGTD